jgi:hypothetical protein
LTPIVRMFAGLLLGVVVGLAVIVLVVLTKPPFLVNSPRSLHPLLLAGLVVVPAVAGALISLVWQRRRPTSRTEP